MSTGNRMLDVLIELTAAYTVERDTLAESYEDRDGTINDPEVRAEIEQMDALIARAERIVVTARVMQ